jgi:copper transport protein
VAAQTLARFSTAAAGVLVALVATGSLLAWRIQASWDNLFDSTYGRLLLVKIGVVVVAVAIAAWNRFVLLPRARASVGFAHRQTTFNSIGRTIVAEAALLVGVLLLTGFLVNQSPREAATAVPAGRTGAQAAQLGDLKVVATMTPQVPGQNTLLVQIQDTAGEPAESTRLPVISVRSAGVDLGVVPVTSSDAPTPSKS